MTLYAVEILDPQSVQGIANNLNNNQFSLSINSGVQAKDHNGTSIANLALVDSTSQASAIAAAISVTTTGSGTVSLREAGQTGHQAPNNEQSLAEALGLQPNQLIYGYEDAGDADYNDGYARVRVTVADDASQAAVSESGIKYGVGEPVTASTSLASGGFGWSLGERSSWSTDPVFAADSVLGNGWSSGSQLRAVNYGSSVKIDAGNGSAWYFNNTGGGYAADFGGNDKLTATGTGTAARLSLQQTDGTVVSFFGFDASIAAAKRGQLDTVTDSYGNVTTAAYNGSNQIATITRSTGSGSTSVVETLTFTYGTTGGATGRVTGVTQSRNVGGGGDVAVRATEYVYYDSGDGNGNAGDLKQTILHDGGLGGSVISQNYYRYYVTSAVTGITRGSYSGTPTYATATATGGPAGLVVGDLVTIAGAGSAYDGTFKVIAVGSGTFSYLISGSAGTPTSATGGSITAVARGYKGGLKYSLLGAAYDRATTVGSPLTLSDAALAPYATAYYEYSGDRQVTKAVTAGTGDSTTTGGLGTSTFTYAGPTTVGAAEGYNNWSTKTTSP